jgi:menaquinone-9 beta-reductase
VLIIGAGPAGSSAARVLALAGVNVVLADQRAFPRDKVCGDALIRDALDALAFLGIDEAVRRESWRGEELRVYAPNGTYVSLRGELACLPRERFDQILFDAALDAGARFVQGTATTPVINTDRVGGAHFKDSGNEWRLDARFTILATGANATVLEAFLGGPEGPPLRISGSDRLYQGLRRSAGASAKAEGALLRGAGISGKPDAVAGRAYYEAPPAVAAELAHLSIVYQREWCPGYGWIFPGPEGRFNVGVGLFGTSAGQGRLHQFFAEFGRTFPPAAHLIRHSRLVREFRGAPIRSGLHQELFGRPGLLAAGEAVATTYAATGEGIGKAMESGILAAELIRDVLGGRRSANGLEHAYRRRFQRRYFDRYRAYRVAQRWAGRPMLLNLLARRANRGTFVQAELEALVAERGNATALFSAPGLLKALVW